MNALVQFEGPAGEVVVINVTRIAYMTEDRQGTTRVIFGDGASVVVKGTPTSIGNRILEAP